MKYLYILTWLLLFSCNLNTEKSQQENNFEDITLSVSPSDAQELKLSNLINYVDYIPLETSPESLIGIVSKISIVENKFFLFDRFSSKALFCFDREGNFLYKIQASGHGPGEFSYPTDCEVTSSGISIWDLANKKILFFDLDGNFLSEKMILLEFDQYQTLNDSTIALYTVGENVFDGQLYDGNLLLVDSQFSKVLYQSNPHIDGQDDVFWTNSLSKPNYFNYSLNDTIYQLTSRSPKPYLTVDFGLRKPPKRIVEKSSSISEDLNDQGFAFMVHNFIKTSTHYHFSYQYKYGFHHVVATNEKTVVIKSYEDDLLGGYYQAPIGQNGDTLLSIIEARDMFENTSVEKRMSLFDRDVEYDGNPIIALATYAPSKK